MDKEIMKGSIDILILSLLSKRSMYGYEIAKSIKKESDDLYNMGEGTLYPALKRLEAKGYLKSYWEDTETGKRRRYYAITEEGEKILKKKLENWHILNSLITKVSREAFS
ncbi:PadR family transcriptional regulator [Paenactinomyces guangxiensis]|uniref:PadR family transcriptional regulator n=1 Tax=Paenactinomyces guangxiensis TaxID=1490290 RepID=A0A7W2AAZ2_9BACL|nr:PadR family transcriptional regulator [Paenactinomyces guangxiensis]MBA4496368.1 PadR family transcriptional regulator [Paenactinomyces guangxiensis]MBH8593519.1 PadR family transcriptional regulator [Paenactinomyces guangxiensis]